MSESLWVFVFVAGAFRADELSVSPVLSSVVQFQKVCAAVAGDGFDDARDVPALRRWVLDPYRHPHRSWWERVRTLVMVIFGLVTQALSLLVSGISINIVVGSW